jgi:hypothetical protein
MKTFYPLLLCVSVTFSLSNAFAQTGKKDSTELDLGKEMNKVFGTKVLMDVDTVLFDSHHGNFYINEANSAMIMTMFVPQGIARVEADFNKNDEKKDVTITEKKKFVHNGKTILFQKGLVEKEGQKVIMYLYAVEFNTESSIFITATHKEGVEKSFFPAIERAALSARLAAK